MAHELAVLGLGGGVEGAEWPLLQRLRGRCVCIYLLVCQDVGPESLNALSPHPQSLSCTSAIKTYVERATQLCLFYLPLFDLGL